MLWGHNDDTFVIKNIADFVKILPKYFRTRNYSSFVRQLNIYGFYKVKNAEGCTEFQHRKFKKSCFNDLANIKRQINTNTKILEKFEADQGSLADIYTKLKTRYREIEGFLDVVKSQNKRLAKTNEELVSNLSFYKKEYKNRIKKILFCFYVNSTYHNEEVAMKVWGVLEQAGLVPIQPLDATNCSLLCGQIQIMVAQLTKKLIFSLDKNVKVLDRLIKIYIEYINDNVVLERSSINWRAILSDMFGKEPIDQVIPMCVPEPFTVNINRLMRSREDSLHFSYKSNTELSFLNLNSIKDNESDVESRSANMNEEDLLKEITRKLTNGPQSMNDSFFASDTNSLHLFSPRSECSAALKF